MANIARDIFKAYDIRGIVGKTLTNEAAYLIGKAIATRAAEKGITRIALGRDGRLSGPELMEHIQRGFTDSGINVLLGKPGPTDTPMTAHLKQQGARLASSAQVAQDIVNAVAKGRKVLYTPGKWALIMLVIRNLPAFVFNRLDI